MMNIETNTRSIPTLKNMEQVYANYTSEDHKVWQVLFDRQVKLLQTAAADEFIKGLAVVGFTRDCVPNFEQTNEMLGKATGWQLVAVEGIVDDAMFFQLLSQKKFPATTWLRKMEELDYLEEPDMFHDVFAHVPLLANQAFVDFLQSLSALALEYLGNSEAIHLLSRIYWYTVEFGLIQEGDHLRIYGAGILSSAGETVYSTSDQPEHLSYGVTNILDSTYRKDEFQEKYFIIHSFEELYASLGQIKQQLDSRVSELVLAN